MLRWLKTIGVIIGGLIVVAVLAGVGYGQIMRWRAGSEVPVGDRPFVVLTLETPSGSSIEVT